MEKLKKDIDENSHLGSDGRDKNNKEMVTLSHFSFFSLSLSKITQSCRFLNQWLLYNYMWFFLRSYIVIVFSWIFISIWYRLYLFFLVSIFSFQFDFGFLSLLNATFDDHCAVWNQIIVVYVLRFQFYFPWWLLPFFEKEYFSFSFSRIDSVISLNITIAVNTNHKILWSHFLVSYDFWSP